MTVTVTYDLTRLLLRSFGAGLNGIDRVDLNLAKHFLGSAYPQNCGMLLNRLRPAVIKSRGAAALIDFVDKAWRENVDFADDPTYLLVRECLLGSQNHRFKGGYSTTRIVAPSASRVTAALRVVSLLAPQLVLPRRVPDGSIFIHTTQFPAQHLFQWLDRRPDVKPVFFIHDLLPLSFREFFTPKTVAEHLSFLEIFIRYGRAAIVNSEVVKNDVVDLLKRRSSKNKEVIVAPMPADPIFARPTRIDPELRARPYFVICGTIEPRKNHLLLLKIWQELVRSEGANTPKLVIIGRRGWNNKEVFAVLDQAQWVSSHVIEVSGLASDTMRQVIGNASALLMPSFAEGYGFPIVESLAMGTPVIASDLDIFREVGGGRITYCNPNNAAAWTEAIQKHSVLKSRYARAATAELENRNDWVGYFRNISTFIGSI